MRAASLGLTLAVLPVACAETGPSDAADAAATDDTALAEVRATGGVGGPCFIDIPMGFDGVYCSARLDCTFGADDVPIALLEGDEGVPGPTIVVGFACAAIEEAAAERHVYLTEVVLECADGAYLIGPPLSQERQGPLAPALFARQSYVSGVNDGAGGAWWSWNLAFGVVPEALDGCTLRLRGAVAPPAEAPWTMAATERFVIDWAVPVSPPGGGALSCRQHDLSAAEGAFVRRVETGETRFCHRFVPAASGGEGAFETDLECLR